MILTISLCDEFCHYQRLSRWRPGGAESHRDAQFFVDRSKGPQRADIITTFDGCLLSTEWDCCIFMIVCVTHSFTHEEKTSIYCLLFLRYMSFEPFYNFPLVRT